MKKITFEEIIAFLTFRDLPINRKFLFFSLGYLFWFCVISLTCFYALFAIKGQTDRVIEETVPWGRTAEIMIRKLRGASISVHKIVLYRDDIDAVKINYQNAFRRLEQCKSFIISLKEGGTIQDVAVAFEENYIVYKVKKVTNPDYLNMIILIEKNINELLQITSNLLLILNEGKYNPSEIHEILLENLAKYDSITKNTVYELAKLSNLVIKKSEEFRNHVNYILISTILIVIFSSLTGILLSIIFGYLMNKSIKNNIDQLSKQIEALTTGEIDLKKRLIVHSKDEIGNLCKSFNKLIDSIEYLNSFKKIIEEDESLEDVYKRLGDIFTKNLGLNCLIFEVTQNKNLLRCVYPSENKEMKIYCSEDILSNCNLCRAKRTGQQISSIEYNEICHYFNSNANMAYICVPIMIAGEVGGVVQFLCDTSKDCKLDEVERKVARAKQFLKEAQPVLEAKRLTYYLKQTSIKDPLTGLYNRRFIEESFTSLVAGIKRRNSIMGILMCDIDYFKEVNDNYGHDIGDIVIKEIAHCITKTIRSSDYIIRYGGEEFLILLMDITKDSSVMIAEKIRAKVQELEIKTNRITLHKTISIGVSEYPTDTVNFWEAVKYADVALYKAKEAGRNKVVRFEHDMWKDSHY